MDKTKAVIVQASSKNRIIEVVVGYMGERTELYELESMKEWNELLTEVIKDINVVKIDTDFSKYKGKI